jgi:hypothetical protein
MPPTADQLADVDPTDSDGSTMNPTDDDTTQYSWPDGTSRVNYPDGTATVSFPDFSTLNIASDGTRTLNDVNGNPLDPVTGGPVGGGPAQEAETPTPPATLVQTLQSWLSGEAVVDGIPHAKEVLQGLEAADALKEALEGFEFTPLGAVKMVVEMTLEVLNATETEERGCRMRGWCYTVVYDAMGMGTPPEPPFSGSLKGPDQDALDKQWWDDGVAEAQKELADGTNGTILRNTVMLLVAKNSADPVATLNQLWTAACEKSGDGGNAGLLAAYPSLDWPTPVGA